MELLEVLNRVEPGRMVVIDTLGFSGGTFPADDHVDRTTLVINDQDYDCVILQPRSWPAK
jgi:hypothetical protein